MLACPKIFFAAEGASSDPMIRRGFVIASWRMLLAATALSMAASPESPPPSAMVLEGAYSAEVMTVVRGGLQRGSVYRGLAETAMQVDLASAFGAPAATVFRVSGMMPHGGDLSGARIGDLQGASNIVAYNHAVLYELWLGGKVAGDFADWRIGRLLADADFATTESGGALLNSSFGWPAFISGNTLNTGPAYDRSALGVFGKLGVTSKLNLQVGCYDGDSLDDANGDPSHYPDGLHFELGHGQGYFAIGEISLDTTCGPSTATLPGTIKIGAWSHSASFADQFDPECKHSGNHGFYFVGEQMLWRETDSRPDSPQGLTAFARTGVSPGDRSRFSQTADAGLSYRGLLANRPADTFSLGLAWVRISSEARRAEITAGTTVISDYELAVEVSYQFTVHEHWRIVPDVQWIRHPGASRLLGDALVVGLRTRVEM